MCIKRFSFQRRRWCPSLCSLLSSSTLELLQLSTFEFKLFKLLIFADPSEKKFVQSKGQTKKIKLKLVFFSSVFDKNKYKGITKTPNNSIYFILREVYKGSINSNTVNIHFTASLNNFVTVLWLSKLAESPASIAS